MISAKKLLELLQLSQEIKTILDRNTRWLHTHSLICNNNAINNDVRSWDRVNKEYEMAFCTNCGNKVNDGAAFCGNCGAPIGKKAEDTNKNTSANNTQTNKPATSANSNDTLMGVLAYLGFLVLIPIFAAKDSKFARFHANQGLILCILGLIWWVLLMIIGNMPYMAILAFIYRLLEFGGGILLFILMVLGIINVAKGEEKELPVIGKFRILK